MSRSSSFVAGALLGAAIGSIVALLYAPKSGEELRKEIQEKTGQITLEVKKAAAQKKRELEEEINSFKAQE
ncbi:MAG TPA: YtxH domain-containing protein [Anaerolineaceae bacterium]|jgi:gas vesicle protein|nr:YtxH domain-containing protein [Anaerolineaceae bacterium]